MSKPIAPCLWLDTEAEDAARFYCSVFPNSKITATSAASRTCAAG